MRSDISNELPQTTKRQHYFKCIPLNHLEENTKIKQSNILYPTMMTHQTYLPINITDLMKDTSNIKSTINPISINILSPPTSSSQPMTICLPTNAVDTIMQQLTNKKLVKLQLRCGYSIDI